jgi:hypothetical protein
MTIEMEKIIKEVLYRLGQLKKVVVIDTLDYSEELLSILEESYYLEHVATVEVLLKNYRLNAQVKPWIYIPQLSCCEMMQVATGVGGSQIAEVLSGLLLRGFEVRVQYDCVEFLNFEKRTSPLYNNHLMACDNILQSGLVIENYPDVQDESVSLPTSIVIHQKKLLDEKELMRYEKNGQYHIRVSNKVLITPLAQDYLRQSQITILRE